MFRTHILTYTSPQTNVFESLIKRMLHSSDNILFSRVVNTILLSGDKVDFRP